MSEEQELTRDDLIEALTEAADGADVERVDEILDLLRLEADYELLLEDLLLAPSGNDEASADWARERLRSLPTLKVFSALRSTTN